MAVQRRAVRRLRGLPIGDVALAVIFAAFTVVSATLLVDYGFSWWYLADVVVHAVVAGAIPWRRVIPVTSFVVTVVAFVAYAWLFISSPVNLGFSPVMLAAPLSLWAVTRWARSKAWGLVGLVLGLIGATLNPAVIGMPNVESVIDEKQRLALFGVPAIVMMGVAYAWAAYLRSNEERFAAQLKARVEAQRVTLARELHDVVGHGLTAIKVKAQTALYLDDQREALEQIKQVADGSLADVRALVDALADDSVSADPASINEIIARAGRGVEVRTLAPDEIAVAEKWPLALRLAVVRCAQEVTTNLIKYGNGTGSIAVRVGSGRATIDAENPIRARGEGPRTRRGLVNMAQRVGDLRGEVITRDDDGVFTIHIEIPCGGGER